MSSPRRVAQSPRPIHLLAAFAAAALCGAVGCAAEAPARPDPQPAADAQELARIDKSRKSIDEGSRALSEKRYAEARKLLNDASAIGVESHRYEIRELLNKVDKREAKLWANETSERLDQKDCAGAFDELSKQIEELKSEVFAQEVRRLVQSQAVACASAKVDEATVAGKFADARAFLAAQPTRRVLGEATWERLSAELDATIAEALFGQISADVSAGNWATVVEKVDLAVKKGDATEAQGRAILGRARAAAAPVLSAAASKALGARDAEATLKQLDATIALLRWEVLTPDVAGLAKESALPEDLQRKRAALATWVEAQRLKMKPLKKPEKRWTHGVVAVAPAQSAAAESKRDLKPSAEVWVLGTAKQLALVSEADPGNGASGSDKRPSAPNARPAASPFEVAIGWVPAQRLASTATLDWVPPNDQLKGERVWGPLREKQPTLELGVVSDVQGADVLVKRLADDAVVKLSRKQLRSGRLAPGTKVLALCKAENDTATIVEVPPAAKLARIQCEGGLQKEESLASLRTKPEFLPPSR